MMILIDPRLAALAATIILCLAGIGLTSSILWLAAQFAAWRARHGQWTTEEGLRQEG